MGQYSGPHEAWEEVGGWYHITATQSHDDLDREAPRGVSYACTAHGGGGWGVQAATCCTCASAASGWSPLLATRTKFFKPREYRCYYGCVQCNPVSGLARL